VISDPQDVYIRINSTKYTPLRAGKFCSSKPNLQYVGVDKSVSTER